mgnify:CR=1 FL=1
MRVIPIPLNSDDPNERRGLPKDYASLTVEGQRQARVNAVRQHLCTQDPEERALRFVRVVHFFDDYYLTADEEADFNPAGGAPPRRGTASSTSPPCGTE